MGFFNTGCEQKYLLNDTLCADPIHHYGDICARAEMGSVGGKLRHRRRSQEDDSSLTFDS